MKRGSKEFHELLQSFESVARDVSGSYIYDMERYRPELGKEPMKGQYYNNGATNAAFNMYLMGYQHAKCLARTDSLELAE